MRRIAERACTCEAQSKVTEESCYVIMTHEKFAEFRAIYFATHVTPCFALRVAPCFAPCLARCCVPRFATALHYTLP